MSYIVSPLGNRIAKFYSVFVSFGLISFLIIATFDFFEHPDSPYNVLRENELTHNGRSLLSINSTTNFNDVNINTVSGTTTNSYTNECEFDNDCNHGVCRLIKRREYPDGINLCICDKNYVSRDGGICNYKRSNRILVFIMSFFFGFLGVDRFILARGNGCYTCLAVGKLLTLGWFVFGWLVEWIIIASSKCIIKDGNKECIGDW